MQLINGISSDFQKLLRYFNGTVIVEFFRTPLAAFGAGWAILFSNSLALYLKYLKILVFATSTLKLVVPSLKKNLKLPIVSE